MYKVLISATFFTVLVASCTTEPPKKVNVGAVYQNYTVCPPNAQLNADSRLLVSQLPAGSQQIVTLTNGLRCVYVTPAYLQAQH
jgi:hypothetical protein